MLQPDPRTDRTAYEARKAKELRSTGWIDRGKGIARIPIDTAMKIVATRGVPDWGQHVAVPVGQCALLADDVPRAPQPSACSAPHSNGAAAPRGRHE